MPCSLTKHPDLHSIDSDLLGYDIPLVDLASRYNVPKSNLDRHRNNCLKQKGKGKIGERGAGDSKRTVRAEISRPVDDLPKPLTPEQGLARMQRWLDKIDQLIFESPSNVDRNQLLAIKAGIDLVAGYFKNAGWVQDGAVVNVLNVQQRDRMRAEEALAVILDAFPEATHRFERMELLRFLQGHVKKLPSSPGDVAVSRL